LEKRSELDQLQHQNIVRDQRVAPALQGAQQQLELNLAKSNLYHALKRRPAASALQERGILHGNPYLDDEEEEYAEQKAPPRGRSHAQSSSASSSHAARSSHAAASSVAASGQSSYEPSGYQRRSKNFHLTRILLKFVASMAEAGEISLQQKAYLKDLIVDQDKTILAVAEAFDADNDLNEFKEALIQISARR